MEQLKKNRRIARAMFTKNADELKKLFTENATVNQIKTSWELLVVKDNKLKSLDEDIYNLLLENEEVSEENLMEEQEVCETYRKKFVELSIMYEDVFRESNVEAPREPSLISEGNVSTADGRGKRNFKLPTIEFKTFDGNVKDWLPFWSQFCKVHEDPDIDLNDKVEYLIKATVPGSRARQLVNSFPAVGKNYQAMIDCLKSRFGREDLQIEVSVRELLKLIIRNASSGGKIELCSLYDGIETQLRVLETLGITSSGCSAMLFPLIESCLPEDLLRVWQRSSLAMSVDRGVEGNQNEEESSIKRKLKNILLFLKSEVENEQKITLASEGFGLSTEHNLSHGKVRSQATVGAKHKSPGLVEQGVPTAAGLVNFEKRFDSSKCIFCEGNHDSPSCFKAQDLTVEKRKEIAMGKKSCYRCLKGGHQAKKCRERLKCIVCRKPHVTLMCPYLQASSSAKENPKVTDQVYLTPKSHEMLTCTNGTGSHVFLQTLRVTIIGNNGTRTVRVLIDTGSQNSYILRDTAVLLGYQAKRQSRIKHCLFGGAIAEATHDCYDIQLTYKGYNCTLEVLSQPMICTEVSSVFDGPWMEELDRLNIHLADSEVAPIEILIGSDVAGKLYTGRRHILDCGLVAVETLLGWTIMGRIPMNRPRNHTLTAISLFSGNMSLNELWSLEVIGIRDPADKKTSEQLASAAREFFAETVEVDIEGRYQVRLPWIEGHPPLPNNYNVAKRRLQGTIKKLEDNGLQVDYDEIFQEWMSEKIIEEVPAESISSKAHFLPHRPVIKEGSTTKLRPVFDASSKEKGAPSLNQCLEKGVNLIELIPDVLLKFRQNKIGVTADIRKAFLQIGIHQDDRDFLCFLWMDSEGNEKIYRHRRVVFGITSSPFLLGATIDIHITRALEKCEAGSVLYSQETLLRLRESFYVDNCVTSVTGESSLTKFIQEASTVMAEAQFDLRGWEFSHQLRSKDSPSKTPLLGLSWNTEEDTLSISEECLKDIDNLYMEPTTKRKLLSMAQRIFDPIGFTCPTSLIPKILLQKTWEQKMTWDTPVRQDVAEVFHQWLKDAPHLLGIKIPRWIHGGPDEAEHMSLHTFCDASKDAYAAVVFLRCIQDGKACLYLLAAKSRVAPLKKLTIPRLELLAALIGVRLSTSVKKCLGSDLECFFWTDSSTVLSWICQNEEWSTFVYNRVAEIRLGTSPEMWRHVPGTMNPADLPSRGCSARQLKESRWWEGPRWLYEEPSTWPNRNIVCNEAEISQERKKRLVTTLLNSPDEKMTSTDWHLSHFSKYSMTVRMVAWIFRFSHNLRHPDERRQGELTVVEIDMAEVFIFKLTQRESFEGLEDKSLSTLNPFEDEYGVIRLKSQVSARKDFEQFRFPVVLPKKHPVVSKIIYAAHVRSCHVGTQGLMSILREKYWILGGRRAIKAVISKCVVCQRHKSRPFTADAPPLPLDRVREAAAFEVTGVDFAGPLFLRQGQKAWICLFTCAIYRAVHLELCTSLSVPNFLQAFRRFISRRGRPRIIYSDNGTNFVGSDNAFRKLDWDRIAEISSAERITWRFNPPSAPWWGGFWERLVGVLKQLLRKTLSRASLNYEELITVLCDCEYVINSRPLTYMSNEPGELEHITPLMFLRERQESGVPDCDAIDTESLCKRVLYQKKVREELRCRFRNEYLGQLKSFRKSRPCRPIKVGEVVLIGNDHEKRIDWPLGLVTELVPGRDGQIRLVKLTTAKGQLMRPIQRLYRLEYPVEEEDVSEPGSAGVQSKAPETRDVSEPGSAGVQSRVPEPKLGSVVTRHGRVTRIPQRFL